MMRDYCLSLDIYHNHYGYAVPKAADMFIDLRWTSSNKVDPFINLFHEIIWFDCALILMTSLNRRTYRRFNEPWMSLQIMEIMNINSINHIMSSMIIFFSVLLHEHVVFIYRMKFAISSFFKFHLWLLTEFASFGYVLCSFKGVRYSMSDQNLTPAPLRKCCLIWITLHKTDQ